MTLLTELALAVKEGSIATASHFAIQWLVNGWTLAKGQLACLLSGYSLSFYALNLCFSVSRQALGPVASDSWLVWFSRFASDVFEPILNLGVIYMFAPWIPTALTPSHMLWRLTQTYVIITWLFNFALSMSRHMANNGMALFSQHDIMHRVHQVLTTAASAWFIIRHITALLHRCRPQTVSKETSLTHEQYLDGSNEQQHIYWVVREIVTNCNTHWRKTFPTGCHLEEGASAQEVEHIEKCLGMELPSDYKMFLQFTNGLENILDGGKPQLSFLSTKNHQIAHQNGWRYHVYNNMWEHYITWLVDSMFGPGHHAELKRQTSYSGGDGEPSLRLIQIAARGSELGGVFLVSPEDVRNTVRDWADVAFTDEKRNGRLIGRIDFHGSSYFGGRGRKLLTLKNCENWLVLQVQHKPSEHYRLYPSFTAFLQTLAEITRRGTTNLILGLVYERYYADRCRWKWEWEWNKRAEDGEDYGIGAGGEYLGGSDTDN